jgi:tight adherence protein B
VEEIDRTREGEDGMNWLRLALLFGLSLLSYVVVDTGSGLYAFVISLYVFMFVYQFLDVLKTMFNREPVNKQFLTQYFSEMSGEAIEDSSKEAGMFRSAGAYTNVLTRRQYILFVGLSCLVAYMAVYILVHNVFAALCFAIISGLYYPKYYVRTKLKKRREIFTMQFKEALYSIANSLKSGGSFANSLERAAEDMRRLYGRQKERPIVDELEIILYDMKMGASIDEALLGFKHRTESEDVSDFVNASLNAKKSGGNLAEVMNNVARIIGDKITIQNEIMVATASKRSEAAILSFMPFVILGILLVLSPDYMKPMYETTLGQVLMTLGIVMLAVNFFISKKIMDIKV